MKPLLALLLAGAALACAAGCRSGERSASAASSASSTPREAKGPKPKIELSVRGNELLAGKPVPLRLHLVNETPDVLIPISISARQGHGGARWSRQLVGGVAYDAAEDRYVEDPVAQRSDADVLFRSAVMPGKELVEDFEVRYPRVGPVSESFTLLYHEATLAAFESQVYVPTGDAMPRRFEPIKYFTDKYAREGALLAGFYVRAPETPYEVSAAIALDLPPVPSPIAKKIEDAGLDPQKAVDADWAGGWIAGDDDRSLIVGETGKPQALAGVPIAAIDVIDRSEGAVSFCVTGATREEIAPLFQGYDVVPFKCLHVSVPREQILSVLQRISNGGFAVKPIQVDLREALDVTKRPRE